VKYGWWYIEDGTENWLGDWPLDCASIAGDSD
jgi:hypothetical protein